MCIVVVCILHQLRTRDFRIKQGEYLPEQHSTQLETKTQLSVGV
ncbi:hypothetical protein L917_21454 [Phytophthora nicotianae]|uniref:Uncharacterized protein n=1 Tax=Phytophthora nicotianae TaxID=4792 RepID=W2JZN5_PHYNI|nr:hypothetical protein L917_21454 [Phytophthora nicotianae]